MTKWEYLVKELGPNSASLSNINDTFDHLGDGGWEFAGFSPWPNRMQSLLLFFKRPIEAGSTVAATPYLKGE